MASGRGFPRRRTSAQTGAKSLLGKLSKAWPRPELAEAGGDQLEHSLFNARYYETYYFASAIRNILHDQFAYIRRLDDFYGDDKYLSLVSPFRKYSAFHCFIEFVIDDLFLESIDEKELQRRQDECRHFGSMAKTLQELKPWVLPIEEALDQHGLSYTPYGEWLKPRNISFEQSSFDDVYEYYNDLRTEGSFEELLLQAVRETFFVLFQNRHLLLLFNEMISRQLENLDIEDLRHEERALFTAPGVLRRQHVPKWAETAVFYRDRGMCVLCHRDLSGMLSVGSKTHYDHMVPLAQGGLNDVTNLQLLCQDCNLQKASRDSLTSTLYEEWYPMADVE